MESPQLSWSSFGFLLIFGGASFLFLVGLIRGWFSNRQQTTIWVLITLLFLILCNCLVRANSAESAKAGREIGSPNRIAHTPRPS